MVKSSLKIGYLSSENPTNKKVWSGTHHAIFKQLQSISEVIILGPHQPKLQLFIGKLINQFCLKFLNKRFDYRHSFMVSKAYAHFFEKRIQQTQPDILVAPAASTELAFLKSNLPIYYITDGTFSSCLNYHNALTNLMPFNIRQGNEIEKRALVNSSIVIVSSNWAYRSATQDYNISADKIKVLAFGANFEKLPGNNEISYEIPLEWKLLFVGVYWKNKGGDIAFKTLKLLLEQGYNVSLTVLGCIPPEEIKHPKMQVIPFIDKNLSEGRDQLFEIYKQHHLLILPTRFDCTPIVINEASAFGMPCFVSKTGGVEGHLQDGKNGFLIDAKDQGPDFAKKIAQVITDPQVYVSLRRSTRKEYEDRLNWQHWTEAFKNLIQTHS